MENRSGLFSLPELQPNDIGHGRNLVRENQVPTKNMVSGNLVCNQPKEWSQRIRFAACSWSRELSNSLDMAAKTEARNGASR